MTILDYDVLPPTGWEPKSAFFRSIWAENKRRAMTAEQLPKQNIRLAMCPTDDRAFFVHDGREWCPDCGQEPDLIYDLNELFEAVNTLAELAQRASGQAEGEPRQSRRRGNTQDAARSSLPLAAPEPPAPPADTSNLADASAIGEGTSEPEAASVDTEAALATSDSEPESDSGDDEAGS